MAMKTNRNPKTKHAFLLDLLLILSILFLLFFFKLGYIQYMGEGFEVTILIRLTLYIFIYISPVISPPQPPSNSTQGIARGFLVLFHIGI
jgi:hypothetical protein